MNSLKFYSQFKFPIWGGAQLSQLKHEGDALKIGESWELSALPGEASIIANEPDAGVSFDQFVQRDPVAVLGETVVQKFGEEFPLLFKLIDAGDALSLQVHPDDELAQSKGMKRGKTEMWYVVNAEADAHIIAGLARSTHFEELSNAIANDTVSELLVSHQAASGDLYYIEAGTVHAIGKGCLIAEIQQASDATYRLYDYDRKDAKGNRRELHLDAAKDALIYDPTSTKIEYERLVDGITPLVKCPYFTANLVEVKKDNHQIRDLQGLKSFVVYMCIKGKVAYMDAGENAGELFVGETLFVPASLTDVVFLGNEQSELLEIYIS